MTYDPSLLTMIYNYLWPPYSHCWQPMWYTVSSPRPLCWYCPLLSAEHLCPLLLIPLQIGSNYIPIWVKRTFLWFSLCASPRRPGWNLYLQYTFHCNFLRLLYQSDRMPCQQHKQKKIFLHLPAKSMKKSSALKISPRPALATSFRAIVDFPLRLFVERIKLLVNLPSG